MSAARDRLLQVRAWYAQSLGEAFREASAITEPAGSSPAWVAICQRAGVAMCSPEEREQIRNGQRPTRGAPLMEFQAVVDAIVKRTRYEHASLRNVMSDDFDKLWEEVRRVVEETEADMLKAYRAAVLPKRSGGMFANATAHVSGNGPQVGAMTTTLTCKSCGAPQLEAGAFVCKYCGNKIV
ncbi:MAG: hypothetical protein ACXVEF_21205 [Polyangiales bacterium]